MFIQFLMAHLGLIKNEKGQGMVEYALLVALISIAAIAVLVLFGPQLRAIFQGVLNAITGAAPAP